MIYNNLSKQEKIELASKLLTDLEVDGEMMEAVVRAVGMESQVLRQLTLKSSREEVEGLVEEKALLELWDVPQD